MQIQELDPNKQYAVVLQGEYVLQADVERLSEKLKAKGIKAVVLAGADIHGGERYWGIWHEWTDSSGKEQQNWYVDTTGRVYYYPSEAVARGAADYFEQIGSVLFVQGSFTVREFN